jgi:cytochrome c-type biogenesis protein CcmH
MIPLRSSAWMAAALALSLVAFSGAPAALQAAPELVEFETPEQDARYQRLVRELRCTVCQNQNLIESNAPLAADLRRQISTMIRAGAETDEVVDYMVARYGDFVLFRPPMNPTTYLLWYGPLALLLIGLAALATVLWRRRTGVASAPLSAAEQERLRQLLGSDGKEPS